MFKSKQANRLLNTIAVMLIIFSLALGYMAGVIDFEEITAPFDMLSNNSSEPGMGTADLTKDIPGLSTVQQYYIKFRSTMGRLENSIAEFDNYFLIVSALLLLFAVKSIISFVPLAATCLISGLVFPFPIALLINIIGVAIILAIKYFWGMHVGEGNFSKLAKKSDAIWDLIKDTERGDGNGNPIILFMLRIVPSVPIGPVSQMYGKLGYDFKLYMLVSLAGYMLKIVSFTVIGCNVTDPFSTSFIAPLVIILFISGSGILVMNRILSRVRAKKEAQKEVQKEAQKEVQKEAQKEVQKEAQKEVQ